MFCLYIYIYIFFLFFFLNLIFFKKNLHYDWQFLKGFFIYFFNTIDNFFLVFFNWINGQPLRERVCVNMPCLTQSHIFNLKVPTYHQFIYIANYPSLRGKIRKYCERKIYYQWEQGQWLIIATSVAQVWTCCPTNFFIHNHFL